MASGGYPGSYEKGKPIVGIDKAEKLEGVTVFHAGTKIDNDGVLVTAGGRVLGVTALGRFLYQAVTVAYCGVGRIKFDKAHFRNDIADRALRRGEH
jgi:phosphoribosylamine--glycine ligase